MRILPRRANKIAPDPCYCVTSHKATTQQNLSKLRQTTSVKYMVMLVFTESTEIRRNLKGLLQLPRGGPEPAWVVVVVVTGHMG